MTLAIDLYGCEPGKADFYGFHMNGTQHAAFATANAALAWWNGLRVQDWFYITDGKGRRVTMHDQPAHPGHAYAILESTGGMAT